MLRELPNSPHVSASMFPKSEGSPSDLPPITDKVDLDNFPPEGKGHVLDHLSYEQIAQLKSLSKVWKALIQSDGFLQAVCLRENPWLTALAFLLANCDPDPDLFKQFLFCANEGLVCMNFSKSTLEERLIVFNPLTQEWKELPPLLHRRNPVLMHMYVDQSSKSYHILAAGSSASGEDSLSRITEIYDSRTGQCERVGDFNGQDFSLNEYQSGVYYQDNIPCTWFLWFGDQTVKGILVYDVDEGIWSTKYTDRGSVYSTIVQLVENNGHLVIFCEHNNGPLIEHRKIGDEEMCEAPSALREGFRVLIGIPHRSSLDHSRSDSLGFTVLRDTIRARMSSVPSTGTLPSNPGRYFWCFILGIVGILTQLNVAGATPTSAPGPLSSPTSSNFPAIWYWGVRSTIAAMVFGAIGLCVAIYMCFCPRERGDNMRSILRELIRPFGEGARAMQMSFGRLKVGEAYVDDFKLRLSPGSSPESSPRSSLV